MVTPFTLDEKYTLVFNDRTKNLDSIFIWWYKLPKTPTIFKKDNNLFMYCLIKNWLTTQEPDNKVYTYFINYMYLLEEKILVDKLLKYIKDFEDKILFINFYYNLITK